MSSLNRVAIASSLALTVASASLGAQCPDGSPPPCRSMTVAMSPKRANPPLDDRTWIVVPFDNLAKSQDVEWLRTASVNLLYLSMSRWTDVHVIDDERVADYMRELPEAKGAQSLSLSAGLAIAKHAGAAKLVMGDVLKLGSKTTVTAKVFDVRTGQRLRSVREDAANPDSVMSAFGKLAQKILNLTPPQGTSNVAAVGTNSMDAFQEYAKGMQAANVFDFTTARAHLEKALQLDSTFALAHAKLSVIVGWDTPGDPSALRHAEAAARLGTNLPSREKTLVNSNVAFARREYVKACEGFSSLIRSDSTDVDAWYGLGDCLFHDTAVEAVNGDTLHMRWRGSINRAVRAFQRALEIDPTYHLAFSHIVDAYAQPARAGRYCVENKCTTYLTFFRPSGDSLLEIPLAVPRDTAMMRMHLEDYLNKGARQRSLAFAQQTARRWVAANPSEDRARLMSASVLLLVGNVAGADSMMTPTRITGSGSAAAQAAFNRVEIALKLWRIAEARRLYDSVRTTATTLGTGPNGAVTSGGVIGLVGPIFGQLGPFDSLITTSYKMMGLTGPIVRMASESPRLLLGLPTDSVAALERAVFDLALPAGAMRATQAIGNSLIFGLRVPRTTWPPIDTTMNVVLLRPAYALARGDTARLRAAAKHLDSLSAVYLAATLPDTGHTIVAADAYLMLRDSAAALRMTRRMLDSALAITPLASLQGAGGVSQPMVPRAILLRADLAAALGYKDEARLWYKRFLDFWANPDPQFQPLIARVKKSYAAVGGTP